MTKKLVAAIIGMVAVASCVVGLSITAVKNVNNKTENPSAAETVIEDPTTESTEVDPADDDWDDYEDERTEIENPETIKVYPTWEEYEKATQGGDSEDVIESDSEEISDSAQKKTEELTTLSSDNKNQNWIDKNLEDKANTEATKSEEKTYKYSTMYVANTDIVNVRKGPDASTEKLGELNKNDDVEAAEYNDKWYIVKYEDGTAYISSDYLSTEKEKHEPVVAHSEWHGSMNVRSGPGTKYDILTTIQYDETVTCTEKVGSWYKITLTDGSEGYVEGTYLYKGEGSVNHGDYVEAEHIDQNSSGSTSTSTSALNPDTDDIYSIVEANSRSIDTDHNNELHDIANELAETGFMYFGTKEEAGEAYDFYATRYTFLGQNENCVGRYTGQTTNGITIHSLTVPTETNQQDTMRNIVKKIGLTTRGSADDMQYICNIMNGVYRYFEYDINYESASMNTALADRRGVCYHFSHAAYVLLNYQGIPARLVSGTVNGNEHVWLEVKIDGKTYTADPTNNTFYEGRPSEYVEQINHTTN